MLQIISNSNETKTGPELVQNGDFSQLGDDLVENGEFDELGTDVITNGGFTGTELVTNGDFLTDLSGWTLSASTPPIWDDGMMKMMSDGATFSIADQSFTTSIGTTYSLVFDKRINTQNLEVKIGTVQTDASLLNLTVSAVQIYTYTFTATSETSWIRVRDGGSSVGAYITDISVKGVGDDWTNGTGWSFGEGKAISTQALGSEEVTNGDFSAEGINLVDNPNFTDTGSELITNGDFATDTDWTITNNVGSSTNISGGSLNIITDGAYTQAAQNNILTLGKSYVLNYTITSNAVVGYLSIVRGSSSSVVPSTVGTHNFYFESDGGDFAFKRGGGALNVSIDSVSVKELGADWSVTMSDGSATTSLKYVEFVETGARFVSDVTAAPYLYLDQSTLSSGKLYKFTCNVAYTDVGSIKVSVGGGGYVTLVEGLNTIYSSAPTTSTQFRFIRASGDVDCIISNVSVQELGEGWTPGTGWSIGDGFANVNNTTSSGIGQAILEAGKWYKVGFEILRVGDGGVRPRMGGLSGTIKNTVGVHSETLLSGGTGFEINTAITTNDVDVTNISVKEIATSYLTQAVSLSAKTWKIIYSVSDYIAGSVSATDYGAELRQTQSG